jgi:hypothetical protein
VAVFTIVPIVEGHGEVYALPILIRRVANYYWPDFHVNVHKPIRRSRDRVVQRGELERDIELAAEILCVPGAILVLLDTDGECPATLGPQLLERARMARPDRLIGVSLAHCEYEAWFLASAMSLRGKRGLGDDIVPPLDPESVRGAKEWLIARMSGSRTYSETVDQPALTALFDIEQARKCASFDKLCRVIEGFIEVWRGHQTE